MQRPSSIVMSWIDRFGMLLLFMSWWPISGAPSYVYSPICRDPDLGGRPLLSRVATENGTSTVVAAEVRKYLLVGGAGAGIGNFLIFFPAAYYFGVFTGRDLLVIDDSLIGELCSVLQCGFPKYNGVAAAYPGMLTATAYRTMGHAKVCNSQSNSLSNPLSNSHTNSQSNSLSNALTNSHTNPHTNSHTNTPVMFFHAKAYDFHRFIAGQVQYEQSIVQADGYKYMSGWYMDRPHTESW